MVSDRSSFYNDRAAHFLSKSRKSGRLARYISFYRIIIFVAFLVLVVLAADNRDPYLLGITTLMFVLIFGLLVNRHDRLRYAMNQYGFIARINEEEISRLKGDLDSFDGGGYFLNEHHPYHEDLDIFGRNSLFQLLNRTTTFRGRKILASWISEPAATNEIQARQEAVREIANDIDWMQEFEATGRHSEVHADTDRFLKWLESGSLVLGNRFYNLVRFIGPVTILTLLVLVLFYGFSLLWFLISLVLNALVLFAIQDKIREIHESTSSSLKSLQSFESLIVLIEKKEFSAERLQEIARVFKPEGVVASEIIRRLRRILLQLDNRSNMIYQLFNIFLMLDLHLAITAEKWKKNQPQDIRNWFGKVGEMEALNSLAGFHFANPAYVFPVITSEYFHFSAADMGHPLIPYPQRINNDFSFDGNGTVLLITGSNMSGKSTFLRTVGINSVLALVGAPVCASEFSISLFRIFTGMRTRDNLEENISSFYAELKRIRQLLDFIPGKIPVLFLLDEILKGTNSNDRHLGAYSLVNQLSELDTAGLISTHDLDLARQTMKSPGIINYSFESTIRDEEILFDYKLRRGICETFNASRLMEKMGIRLIK